MRQRESTFVGPTGNKHYYRVWEPDADPRASVALVHGMGEHCGRYQALAERFTQAGIAVHGFDLPGHGRTPGQRGHINSWEEMRGGVGAFLEKVLGEAPQRPLFLYGHSLGGLIAIDYAILHPEGLRGLIVSAPALDLSGFSATRIALAKVLSRLLPRLALSTGLDVEGLSRDPEVVRVYQEDPLVHDKATTRFGASIIEAVGRIWERAGELDVPLLILHGQDDRLVPADSSARFIRLAGSGDKQRIEYPQGYHEPHNDLQREKVYEDVLGWIQARI